MEKLPGKGMVTAASVIMLIWGLANAGYYDILQLVLADEPATQKIVCGVVVGVVSLLAVIGGIAGLAGSNKVAKASSIVVWSAFMFVLSIVGGIVSLISGDNKMIAVIILLIGLAISVMMFIGASKNRA